MCVCSLFNKQKTKIPILLLLQVIIIMMIELWSSSLLLMISTLYSIIVWLFKQRKFSFFGKPAAVLQWKVFPSIHPSIYPNEHFLFIHSFRSSNWMNVMDKPGKWIRLISVFVCLGNEKPFHRGCRRRFFFQNSKQNYQIKTRFCHTTLLPNKTKKTKTHMDLICDSRINNNNQKPKIFNTEKFSGNTSIHTRFLGGGKAKSIHKKRNI